MNHDSLKVLLVEDDDEIRSLLVDHLESEGMKVDAFPNPQAALDRMHRRGGVPDVILSNFNMPKMDGLEFIHEVRGDAQLPDIPIVLMTAGIAPDRAFIEADAVLHKPMEIDNVIEVLERVYRRKLLREEPGRFDSVTEIASHA